MEPARGPEPAARLDAARELVEATMQGAEVNDRPDLLFRLRGAAAALATPSAEVHPDPVRFAAAQAMRALNSLEADLRARRAMLADPGRGARLRAELNDAQARHERFTAAAREWQYVLGDGFASVTADAEFHLRTRVRAVLTDADTALSGADPAKNREAFQAWLGERLVTEAEATYGRLLAGAERVAATVATHLDLPTPHRLSAPAFTPPRRLVAELPPREPAPHNRPPVPARLLSVLMPAYGGIMMTLVLSRVLGLALPGWFIAACAVVGALTLGGAALSGERGRQRDQRRTEATSAVRALVEEYQLALAKQLRDGARELQQELRRVTTESVTRIGGALGSELEAAKTNAEVVREASVELGDITEDLATLNELRARARALLGPPPVATPAVQGERPLRLVTVPEPGRRCAEA
jgi:hypothetical protein